MPQNVTNDFFTLGQLPAYIGDASTGLAVILAIAVAVRIHIREKRLDHRELTLARANTVYDGAAGEIGDLGSQPYYNRIWRSRWAVTVLVHNVRTDAMDTSIIFSKSQDIWEALAETAHSLFDSTEQKSRFMADMKNKNYKTINASKNRFGLIHDLENGIVLYLFFNRRNSFFNLTNRP